MDENATTQTLITSVEAAGRFGVTNDYVAILARRGKIEGKLVGPRWMVDEESLKNFLVKTAAEKSARHEALSRQLRGEYEQTLKPLAAQKKIRRDVLASLSHEHRGALVALATTALFVPVAIIAAAVGYVPTSSPTLAQTQSFAAGDQVTHDLRALTAAVADGLMPGSAAVPAPLPTVTLTSTPEPSLSDDDETLTERTLAALPDAMIETSGDIFADASRGMQEVPVTASANIWDAWIGWLAQGYEQTPQPVVAQSESPSSAPISSASVGSPASSASIKVPAPAIAYVPIFVATPQPLVAYVTQSSLSTQLQTLDDSLRSLIYQSTASSAAPQVAFTPPEIAGNGDGVLYGGVPGPALSTSDIVSSLTASDIPALNYFPATSTVSISYGGTGTSTAPGANQLMLSDAFGNWEYVSTSSLGIAGGISFTPVYPLALSGSSLLLAFGTTTNNTWAGTQTFGTATTTNLFANVATLASTTIGMLTLNNSLAITSGGTGTSTKPSANQLLLSDALGNWEYVSTSSLGFSSSLSGTQGQFAYFSGANTAVGTSSLYITSAGNLGVGTNSPYAKLTVSGGSTGNAFEIDSTASAASTTILQVSNAGVLSIGDSTTGAPSGIFSVDASSSTTTISNLSIGNLAFDTDAGVVQLSDLPLSATPAAGTIESQSLSIGGTPELTVYGENDGVDTSPQNLRVGIGTTSPYAALSVVGTIVGANFVGTTTATSTLGGGLNIASGCFAVGGTCLTSGALLSVANAWTALQQFLGNASSTEFSANQAWFGATATSSFNSAGTLTLAGLGTPAGAFLAVNGSGQVISTTTPTGTNYWTLSGSSLYNNSGSLIGIGTTSPYALLTVGGGNTYPVKNGGLLFAIASSTGNATTTALSVDSNGFFSIGAGAATTSTTISPGNIISMANSGIFSVDASSSTTTISNLSIGNLEFDTDAGIVNLSDIPVDSNAAAGVQEAQILNIGGNPALTVSGLSNGSGGITSLGVGIGTSTLPYSTLQVWGPDVSANTSAFAIVNNASTTELSVSDSGVTYFGGNVGIGTTSPFAVLSVNGSGFFGGNVTATNITATSTLTALNILATGSTTLQNFTALNATTTNATSTTFAITGISGQLLKTLTDGAVVAAVAGTDYETPAEVVSTVGAAYPFQISGNATSTLTQFNSGLTAFASSTVGNGSAIGGLTISGNATTTGSAYFSGNVAISNLAAAAGAFLAINPSGQVISTTTPVSSQWTTSGSNVYFNTGDVSIGTTSPSATLTVAQTAANLPPLNIYNYQPSGSFTVVTLIYTTNTAWTKPANLDHVVVQVWGGGGGGGGLNGGPDPGGSGGTSYFTYSSGASKVQATGGAGGAGNGNGGSGGTGSGGDTNTSGSGGTAGGSGSNGGAAGGAGGAGGSGSSSATPTTGGSAPGGGGGSVNSVSSGGGGGGGGYSTKTITAASLGSTESITVGGGGGGGGGVAAGGGSGDTSGAGGGGSAGSAYSGGGGSTPSGTTGGNGGTGNTSGGSGGSAGNSGGAGTDTTSSGPGAGGGGGGGAGVTASLSADGVNYTYSPGGAGGAGGSCSGSCTSWPGAGGGGGGDAAGGNSGTGNNQVGAGGAGGEVVITEYIAAGSVLSSIPTLMVSASGDVGIGTSSPYANLSVWGGSSGDIADFISSASTTLLSIAAGGFGTTTLAGLNINGHATSTSNVGVNLTGGCFAVNGTCVGGGGVSLSVANAWTALQSFLGNASTTQFSANQAWFGATATSTFTSAGWLGIGTSTPWAQLSVNPTSANGAAPAFAIGSSTATDFVVTNGGNVGVGTTSPFANLSVQTATNGTALAIANSSALSVLQVSTVNTANNIFEVATSTGSAYFDITSAGNVGVGTTSPESTLTVVGTFCVDKGNTATAACGSTAGDAYGTAFNTGAYDVAEEYTTSDIATDTPGTLVALDQSASSTVTVATTTSNIFGVISTDPGVLLGGADAVILGKLTVPVALSGRVPTLVSLQNGPINVGDRITLSSTPGVGMKAGPLDPSVGIALQSYDGTSTSNDISVFISPQKGIDLSSIQLGLLGTTTPFDASSTLSGSGSTFLQSLFGQLVQWFASAGNGISQFFADVGNFHTVNTNQLCVDKSDGTPVCVTGDQLAAILAGESAASGANSGSSSSGTSASSDATDTPPVIQVSGNNPATIDVGDSYNDLGATITGPASDTNLGISVSVDGGATTSISSIVIDTSQAGTHTIVYSATDQSGLTGTATRTVNVVDPSATSTDQTSDASSTPSQ